MSADTSRANNSTFILGEEVQVIFSAVGLMPLKTVDVAVEVSDEYGIQVASSQVALTADSAGKASATYTAPASKYGYYQVSGSLPDGITVANLGTRPAGFISYSVVPNPSSRVNYGDAGSRFGMQGGFTAAQGNVVEDLGVRYLLDGAGWRDLEPTSAGQFLEEVSAALSKNELSPALTGNPYLTATAQATWATYAVEVVVKAQLPGWAIEPGTTGSICKTMGAMNSAGAAAFPAFAEQYAQQIARNYPNQSSHYYQITWEPASGWCFNGTPEQLVQFYKVSYQAIHNADPKAIVMGPTLFPGDTSTLDKLWAAGLANYIDAISMHPYITYPPESNGLISDVRSQMKAAQTAKGKAVPFLGTEHGYTSASIGDLGEAYGNIRSTLILLGEGFEHDFAFYITDFWVTTAAETKNTYGYYWNLDPSYPYNSRKIAPKPVAPAFAAMTLLLDGSSTEGQMSGLSGTQMGYRFTRNGTTILALWDYKASSSTASIKTPSESVQVCDWMANCSMTSSSGSLSLKLTAAPTYIIGSNL